MDTQHRHQRWARLGMRAAAVYCWLLSLVGFASGLVVGSGGSPVGFLLWLLPACGLIAVGVGLVRWSLQRVPVAHMVPAEVADRPAVGEARDV